MMRPHLRRRLVTALVAVLAVIAVGEATAWFGETTTSTPVVNHPVYVSGFNVSPPTPR